MTACVHIWPMLLISCQLFYCLLILVLCVAFHYIFHYAPVALFLYYWHAICLNQTLLLVMIHCMVPPPLLPVFSCPSYHIHILFGVGIHIYIYIYIAYLQLLSDAILFYILFIMHVLLDILLNVSARKMW